MLRSHLLLLSSAVALLLLPAAAAAHLGLVDPPSRYGSAVLKDGPCGMIGGTRSENVTVYEPGQTIEVVWDEYINHPGHYRVAFDADGDDDFVEPPCLSGCDGRMPVIELYSNDAVLLDGIPDRDVAGGDSIYRVMVTLPDVECDNCTLQVIQVMYDKPPQTRPGNDTYFQCADLILRHPAGTPDAGPGADSGPATADGGGAGVDAGTGGGGDDGCGCRAAGGRAPGAGPAFASGALLLLLIASRRRRPRQRG